jgi:putative addiction module component (TIGR02574 family)
MGFRTGRGAKTATRGTFHVMTRPELAAAIRELPEDEKLELLSELWDALDHSTAVPEWHKEELDRRLSNADAESLTSWSEAKARILGSK